MHTYIHRGEPAMLQAVEAKMPRKIKMRREKEGGFMEEYFDYIFPDDEKKMGSYLCLLCIFFLTACMYVWHSGSEDIGEGDGVEETRWRAFQP